MKDEGKERTVPASMTTVCSRGELAVLGCWADPSGAPKVGEGDLGCV